METTKEMMSNYLEKLQQLQRTYFGHSIHLDADYITSERGCQTFINVWLHRDATPSDGILLALHVTIAEYETKEENDERFAKVVACIENELKWEAA